MSDQQESPPPELQVILEEDRRRAERYECDLHPLWSEWGTAKGDSSRVRVHNISATGLGLITPARIPPGRVIVVKLLSETHGLSRPLLVRIMHSTQQQDGNWLSGGTFVRRLDESYLAMLLQEGHRQE